MDKDKSNLAYVIGVAIGDGNLSNPNGRATRLRITCDLRYKKLIKKIIFSIKKLLPDNKVSIVKRATTYCDISCYSNKWETWLGWKAKEGSKYKQNISVPKWIKQNKDYSIDCLRGLLETDGSIYIDRGYKMVNFVTIISALSKDVVKMVTNLGFKVNSYKLRSKTKTRYNVRISKDVDNFIKKINFVKN
jgi:hypothetical protein